MPISAEFPRDTVIIRGARQNNLKGIDLDLELNKFHVITGPSGSGKSSLAFDTLYAEGQRRYVETFSPYTRQFLERMDKPDVDRIDGLPPATPPSPSRPSLPAALATLRQQGFLRVWIDGQLRRTDDPAPEGEIAPPLLRV